MPGDDEAGVLPESDPSKYEKLHTVGTSPNYYNGMEMSAGFVQTPSGEYSASFRLDDGEAEHGSAKTFEVAGNATLAVVNTRNALIPTGLRLNGAWTAVFLLISLACAVLLIMRRVRE